MSIFMNKRTLICFNSIPGSGSTLAASYGKLCPSVCKSLNLSKPLQTFCSEYFDITEQNKENIDKPIPNAETYLNFAFDKIKKYEPEPDCNLLMCQVFEVKSALIYQIYERNDIDKLYNKMISLKNYITPRTILYIIDEYIRDIDPLYFAKIFFYDDDVLSGNDDDIILLTDVKTNEEILHFTKKFKKVVVIEIIRPTYSNGPNIRNTIDPNLITKKIFNTSDKNTLKVKVLEFVEKYIPDRY